MPLAGRAVVEGVMQWAKRKCTSLPQFIFEDGDKGWEGLVKLCVRLNVVPTRLPKLLATPCQVGDFLAWKTRITATNSLRGLDKLERRTGHTKDNAMGIIREVHSLNKQIVRPAKNGLFSVDTRRSLHGLDSLSRYFSSKSKSPATRKSSRADSHL
jgi:hypothetical protein